MCRLPKGKAGLLLQADMRAARAAWIAEATTAAERTEREGSDFLRDVDVAGRVADFHALRVYFITRLVETGATLKEAMELARHSDPKLTLKTYARVGMHNLGRVLDRLPGTARPNRDAETLRATGTDAADAAEPRSRNTGATRLAAINGDGVRASATGPGRHAGAHRRATISLSGGCGNSVRSGATGCENAEGGTRTHDLRVMNPAL